MKVVVTRSGGFAGTVRRAEVDSADHPEVAPLVERAHLGDQPPVRPAPDRFVYDIEVGDQAVRVGEADLHGPVRDLVDYVLTHSG